MRILNLFAVLAISLFIASCGGGHQDRRDATSVGEAGWIFEGWACAPNAVKAQQGLTPAQYCQAVDEKEHTYLYLKFSAVASENSIRSGRLASMMATCRDAALTQVKGDGISKLIGDYLEQASGVQDGQSTGVAILRESKGLIKGVGLVDCCAIDDKTAKCVKPGEPENWEQCLCVGYMNFPGGQKALETLAEKVSN
jgi:hypothetical protein